MKEHDLGRYAHMLDRSRRWIGPAYVGPGGVFCVSFSSSSVHNPYTVHMIRPARAEVRAVAPAVCFESASRLARSFATG